MKKLFVSACLAAGLLFQMQSEAQEIPSLPVDTAYTIGRLDNGLTYYVRHNEYPKDRAFFYIVQRVGASLEEDSQNGLAHFLEHMAFNGTKNFPGKGIIDYLEHQGVKFGANINAYTSFDETVYNLDNVPTTNPSVIDSALLILHDWSGFISLEEKEIDAERGVILEEWRTRNQANRRMMMKHYQNTMKGTPYEKRDIIGDTAVIKHFTYDAIRKYYHKWYRPDLQGIVVVGDINPKEVEQKIKDMWQDIPAQENPAERVYFQVNLNQTEPIVSIVTDAEATSNRIELGFRRPEVPRDYASTPNAYMMNIAVHLIVDVLDMRFEELTTKADCPATGAGVSDYTQTPLNREFAFIAIAKNGQLRASYNLLLDEMEKLRRWGLTGSELEIAKQNLLKMAEDAYNSRTTCQSANYVNSCVRSFIDGVDLMSEEYEFEFVKQILPFMTKDDINKLVEPLLTNNVVLRVSAPTTEEDIPTSDELIQMLKSVVNKDLAKYEEVSYDKPLVAETPKAGKIVSEEKSIYESTLVKLSNGVEVYLLPTDYAADQISFRAISEGGRSLLSAEDAVLASYNDYFISSYGLGDFSASELTKVLAGKSVNKSTSSSMYSENIMGNCAKGDVETLLQMIYLTFGEPRRDEDAHASTMAMIRTSLENAEKNPDYSMGDTITRMMYPSNPYVKNIKSNDIAALTLDKSIAIFKDRFNNAADFKFILVGDMDIETVKPLLAQWLGSLPTTDKREKPIDRNIVAQTGRHETTFEKEMKTNKTTSWTLYSGELKAYDRHFIVAGDMLNELLRMRYLDTIREDEGGSYGVSSHFSADESVRYTYELQIEFDTDPEKIDRLYPIIEREIRKIAEEGPNMEQLQKVKDNKLNNLATLHKRNGYWMGRIVDYIRMDIDKTQGEKELYENMSGDDIKAVAAQILANGNRLNVTMKPKLQ